MLYLHLALIRPCLNRELVDKSAVSRSRLFCVYPHAYISPYSFPTPPDGDVRLATERLQPALSL